MESAWIALALSLKVALWATGLDLILGVAFARCRLQTGAINDRQPIASIVDFARLP